MRFRLEQEKRSCVCVNTLCIHVHIEVKERDVLMYNTYNTEFRLVDKSVAGGFCRVSKECDAISSVQMYSCIDFVHWLRLHGAILKRENWHSVVGHMHSLPHTQFSF